MISLLSYPAPAIAYPRPIPPLVGADTLTSLSSVDDDRSHGVVFDLRTSADSRLVAVTDLELYLFHTDDDDESSLLNNDIGIVVDYEIYVKEGTWHDASLRDYSPVSFGNLTINNEYDSVDSNYNSSLPYRRHRLPLNDAVRLDGNDTLYSLYVGLGRRILPFQHPPSHRNTGDDSNHNVVYSQGRDYIPLIQTPHLTLYAGAAAMAYPLSKLNHPVYYRKPRGFVGRIWYEWDDLCRKGSGEKEKDIVVRWSDCDDDGYNGVGDKLREEEIAYGDVYFGGMSAAAVNANKDDAVGDVAPNTTANPSSGTPSTEGDEVYLVLTFDETPRSDFGIMNDAAQSSFERVLTEFYSNRDVLSMNDVDLSDVEVWLQQFLVPVTEEEEGERRLQGRRSRESTTSSSSLERERQLQVWQSASSQEMVMFQVTSILTVTHSALPHLVTRELMVNAVRENVDDLFQRLKLTPDLVPYLRNAVGIASVESADALTDPPTRSPTYAPTASVAQDLTIRRETPPGLVGLALLVAVYVSSVLFSTCYIKRSRNAMEHEHDMDRLLKSTTIEPDIRGSKDDFLTDAMTTASEMGDGKKDKKRATLFKRMTVSMGRGDSKSTLNSGGKSKSSNETPRDNDGVDDSYLSEEDDDSSDESESEDSSSGDEGLSIT